VRRKELVGTIDGLFDGRAGDDHVSRGFIGCRIQGVSERGHPHELDHGEDEDKQDRQDDREFHGRRSPPRAV